MPKKFKGENSKAVVAKEKKAAARELAEQEKKKKEEDEYWRDDDKYVMRKQERKVLTKLPIYLASTVDQQQTFEVISPICTTYFIGR